DRITAASELSQLSRPVRSVLAGKRSVSCPFPVFLEPRNLMRKCSIVYHGCKWPKWVSAESVKNRWHELPKCASRASATHANDFSPTLLLFQFFEQLHISLTAYIEPG